jgi:starch synthase
MNLVINDLDMPLIIKVASIPKERMQVYFIDNEDYFKRKATYADEEGNFYSDNDERAIFFAKGVIETVKKLNWSPDIIHVHGWLASFLPLYLRNYYGNEPLFENSRIVTSVYNQSFDGELNANTIDKIQYDAIDDDAIEHLKKPNYVNLMKVAIENSDAVILGSTEIPEELKGFIEKMDIPVLKYHNMDDFSQAYLDFCREKVLQ